MQVNTKKYGLRLKKTGKLLGTNISSNEGADFCGDVSVRLDDYSNNTWLVDSAINAEYVRNFSTAWYNADYKNPSHNYEAEELEVVESIIITSIAPVEVKIPTFEEYMKLKYEKSDPNHYIYVMEEYKKSYRKKDFKYSLWDLQELIRNGKLN